MNRKVAIYARVFTEHDINHLIRTMNSTLYIQEREVSFEVVDVILSNMRDKILRRVNNNKELIKK